MSPLARELRAAAKLDLAEVKRSRWLLSASLVYGALAGIFVLVGLRESSLLGFTGMGRVLLSLCHALLLLLPLLALTATGQVVNRARDDGSLELLFSLPLRRGAWFAAVSAVRYASLLVPLVVLMAAMAVLGRVAFGEAVPWGFLARALATSAALLLAFTGLGLLVSTRVRNPARATVTLLLLWAAGVALLDFGLVGLMLRFRLQPELVFALASVNPVQAARLALLSGVEPELSTLGPVGFWLANRLGPDLLLALGLAWPATVGLSSWTFALRSFTRGDVV